MSDSDNSFFDKSCRSWTGHSDTRSFQASIGNDFAKGHRGQARAVRGAKKFIRSRRRFHHKAELRDIIAEQHE